MMSAGEMRAGERADVALGTTDIEERQQPEP